MASGKPVIAYGSGGVLETAVPLQKSELHPPTGAFFNVQIPEALCETVKFFEENIGAFDLTFKVSNSLSYK
jgi:glycosyltransferase involved in cell wall biosynthesis